MSILFMNHHLIHILYHKVQGLTFPPKLHIVNLYQSQTFHVDSSSQQSELFQLKF